MSSSAERNKVATQLAEAAPKLARQRRALPCIKRLDEMDFRNITPANYRCPKTSPFCSAVFKTNDGTYIVIGKFIRHEDYDMLVGRVGPGEVAIENSAELLEGALLQKCEGKGSYE